MATLERRLEILKKDHARQHDIVESLEAEKAPEKFIKEAKKKKLQLKDQIAQIEHEIRDRPHVN